VKAGASSSALRSHSCSTGTCERTDESRARFHSPPPQEQRRECVGDQRLLSNDRGAEERFRAEQHLRGGPGAPAAGRSRADVESILPDHEVSATESQRTFGWIVVSRRFALGGRSGCGATEHLARLIA